MCAGADENVAGTVARDGDEILLTTVIETDTKGMSIRLITCGTA